MELKKKYQELVMEYTKRFAEKMYGEPNNTEDFWVGNEIGGTICIGDEYWGFDVIRKSVDEEYDPKEVFKWYDYCLRLSMIDQYIALPNIELWMKGCPRYTEEQIAKVEADMQKLRESIENFKEAGPGKENTCEK